MYKRYSFKFLSVYEYLYICVHIIGENMEGWDNFNKKYFYKLRFARTRWKFSEKHLKAF